RLDLTRGRVAPEDAAAAPVEDEDAARLAMDDERVADDGGRRGLVVGREVALPERLSVRHREREELPAQVRDVRHAVAHGGGELDQGAEVPSPRDAERRPQADARV